MDLDQLKQILDLVREHELVRVRDRTRRPAAEGPQGRGRRAGRRRRRAGRRRRRLPAAAAVAGRRPAPAIAGRAGDADETDIELAVVKSPIVGTFYRSPEPGAASFVEIGPTVKKGQVLCIIEAMKLMNEIDSEYDGEVVNVYVENGQPVQYGERLFAIRTK